MILHAVEAIAWYIDSANDLDTVCCFFIFLIIGEVPRKEQKPVVERLVSTLLACPIRIHEKLKSEFGDKRVP